MHNPNGKKFRPNREADEDNNLLEGRNAVTELLRSGQDCDKVFVAQGARMGDIIALAKSRGGTGGRVRPTQAGRHEQDR